MILLVVKLVNCGERKRNKKGEGGERAWDSYSWVEESEGLGMAAMTCMDASVPASLFDSGKECSNCGKTEDLLLCSRCRSVYFCSSQCQKAYWPFHKSDCRKNEFADAIERDDPKFARWMRRHKKLAVLKDDEVDRLERAQHASIGPSREEVMESMYGRLNPKPIQPTYTPEELQKMMLVEASERRQKQLLSERDRVWAEIDVNTHLGLDCSETLSGNLPYKWNQNQTYVEIHIQLPESMPICGQYKDVIRVDITPYFVEVAVMESDGDTERHHDRVYSKIWGGKLFAEVKVDESTWLIRDGILEMTLLKRSRYDDFLG